LAWRRNSVSITKISSYVRENLLLFTVVALLTGLVIGYLFSGFFQSYTEEIKNFIMVVAILTIYPSMIQLQMEKLAKSMKAVKAITLGMIFIFIISPMMAYIFARAISDSEINLGFVTSNVVPASSASMSYVLLAEGNIELATALAVFSLIGAMGTVPAYVGFYAGIFSIPLPIDKIMESIVYTLLTPFIAGQLTRYLLINKRARNHIKSFIDRKTSTALRTLDYPAQVADDELQSLERDFKNIVSYIEKQMENRMKPYLSVVTMVSMFVLIALLIANKAILLVQKPLMALEIIALQAAMLVILLVSITLLDKLLHISYEDHSAMAFISVTKNQSVAAAIAVMALGSKATIPPAIVPTIQTPIAIVYLQMLSKIKNFYQ